MLSQILISTRGHPSSAIPTFIPVHVFYSSLNHLILTGLLLVVGILVDQIIVVLENLYRYIEMGKTSAGRRLEEEMRSALRRCLLPCGRGGVPAAGSPVGLISNILGEFSLVVVLSILTSLVISFTLNPMLPSRWISWSL